MKLKTLLLACALAVTASLKVTPESRRKDVVIHSDYEK